MCGAERYWPNGTATSNVTACCWRGRSAGWTRRWGSTQPVSSAVTCSCVRVQVGTARRVAHRWRVTFTRSVGISTLSARRASPGSSAVKPRVARRDEVVGLVAARVVGGAVAGVDADAVEVREQVRGVDGALRPAVRTNIFVPPTPQVGVLDRDPVPQHRRREGLAGGRHEVRADRRGPVDLHLREAGAARVDDQRLGRRQLAVRSHVAAHRHRVAAGRDVAEHGAPERVGGRALGGRPDSATVTPTSGRRRGR